MRDKCPSQVLLVQSHKRIERQSLDGQWQSQWYRSMKIYCWIGADISVMSSNIVPKECYTGRRTEARGLLPRVSEFDVANITLEVNGWKEDLQVLVAPPKSLKHSVLLGREPYSQYSPPRHHLVVEKVAHTASINNQVAQPSNIKRLPYY